MEGWHVNFVESGELVESEAEEMATSQSDDMELDSEDDQQTLTPEEERMLDVSMGIGLTDPSLQPAQDLSNSRAGQAGSSDPLHAPANRYADHPAISIPEQGSSIPQSSNVLKEQQAAGNRLEQNLPQSTLRSNQWIGTGLLPQSSPTLSQSSLWDDQMDISPVLADISLEQTHLFLQGAPRTHELAASNEVAQPAASYYGIQASSDLQALNGQTGDMTQPETSDILSPMNNTVRLCQDGTGLVQQVPSAMNTNTTQGIPHSSNEMDCPAGANLQLEMPDLLGVLSTEAELLRSLSTQIPPQMNNQTSAPHQTSTPTNGQNLNNATTQEVEVNPLLTSQPPEALINQTWHESAPHTPVDQQNLVITGVEGGPYHELGAPSSVRNGVITGGAESEKELGKVSHSEEHSEALDWISRFVRVASPPFIDTLNDLDRDESQDIPLVQNRQQIPLSQAMPQGVSSEQRTIGSEEVIVPGFRNLLGSSYEKVLGKESDPAVTFSAQFIRMRFENTSHDEISNALTVPSLPGLDEEMVFNSKYTGSDTVPWRTEERNSPTIARIASGTKQSLQGTVVPIETLFNHLFCLFRLSFLQREERVHLELTTRFLKNSRLQGEAELENDTKELICWLERTFNPGHLAKLVQRLVIAIGEPHAMKFLVDRAKSKYNPGNTEMTVLGAFYELMSKQHDAMKTSQDLTKRKKDVEKRIRQAKGKLLKKKIKTPKTTYEKKRTGLETKVEMDHALIRTFNATKWILVGCTDSHYAYAQSLVEGAKLLRKETESQREDTLKLFIEGIAAKERANATEQELAYLKEKQNEVMQRDIDIVEKTVLECFVEMMLALGKVTVIALLRAIGKLPHRLALTLEVEGEELEKVRGIGSAEKPGVEDLVRVAQLVEKETEENLKLQKIVLKKISYLEECQQLLNDEVDPGGPSRVN